MPRLPHSVPAANEHPVGRRVPRAECKKQQRSARLARPASPRQLERDPMPRTPTPPDPSNPLAKYRAKRSLERTPEPAGAVGRSSGRLFVVHLHDATRLHYDLRLEMEGVLRSWAVPKGPSYNTADKRLAVHVEDHPLEYGDFEGLIPKGNYGAGAVIVWDRGEWISIGDPLEGLATGKLLFELRGYKLRGLWTLVKIKKAEKEWLLIKERDEWASTERVPAAESVLSGLTVEALGEGHDAGEEIRRELERLGAPRRAVEPKAAGLMLADTAERAFSRPGWLFEPKLDGYRVLTARNSGGARLLTRNGNDCSDAYPEVDPRGRGAALQPPAPGRRGRGAGRYRAAELPAAAGPLAAQPADRHPPCRGRDAGHLLRLRPPGLRGLRPAPASPHRQEGDPSAPAAAGRGAALSRARRGRRRSALSRGRAARSRGHRREEGDRALQGRPLAGLAQGPIAARPPTTSWWATPRPKDRAAASARCTWPSSWTER